MKKILLFALTLLPFIGCSKDDDVKLELLEGSWFLQRIEYYDFDYETNRWVKFDEESSDPSNPIGGDVRTDYKKKSDDTYTCTDYEYEYSQYEGGQWQWIEYRSEDWTFTNNIFTESSEEISATSTILELTKKNLTIEYVEESIYPDSKDKYKEIWYYVKM